MSERVNLLTSAICLLLVSLTAFSFFLLPSLFIPPLLIFSSSCLSTYFPLLPPPVIILPLLTPHPFVPPFLSSPPLRISAITQFSRVFPFQTLSPCITSEFLLGVPVGYLCALVSICAALSCRRHMLKQQRRARALIFRPCRHLVLEIFGRILFFKFIFYLYLFIL